MFNVPPGGDFMTVIYEFPASAEVTLQHYEIYFLNKELTEAQQKLVEWYRDVFRRGPAHGGSVQRGLKSRGYRGGAGSWSTGSAHQRARHRAFPPQGGQGIRGGLSGGEGEHDATQ